MVTYPKNQKIGSLCPPDRRKVQFISRHIWTVEGTLCISPPILTTFISDHGNKTPPKISILILSLRCMIITAIYAHVNLNYSIFLPTKNRHHCLRPYENMEWSFRSWRRISCPPIPEMLLYSRRTRLSIGENSSLACLSPTLRGPLYSNVPLPQKTPKLIPPKLTQLSSLTYIQNDITLHPRKPGIGQISLTGLPNSFSLYHIATLLRSATKSILLHAALHHLMGFHCTTSNNIWAAPPQLPQAMNFPCYRRWICTASTMNLHWTKPNLQRTSTNPTFCRTPCIKFLDFTHLQPSKPVVIRKRHQLARWSQRTTNRLHISYQYEQHNLVCPSKTRKTCK